MTGVGLLQIVVPAVATLAVAVIGGIFAYKQQKASRDQPSWGELVAEVRQSRTDLNTASDEIDEERHARRHLESRVDTLEHHERSWGWFYDDLTGRWASHRLRDEPPLPPKHYRGDSR